MRFRFFGMCIRYTTIIGKSGAIRPCEGKQARTCFRETKNDENSLCDQHLQIITKQIGRKNG